MSSASQVSSFSPLENLRERAQHTQDTKEKQHSVFPAQRGTNNLEIIGSVLLHWCVVFQAAPDFSVKRTAGSRWAECWTGVTPGKLLEHPPCLFHIAGSFHAGNREASPASWVWPDPQETSLLIRLPLSRGFNFPSFIPTHTSHHSTKAQPGGLCKQTHPSTSTVGNLQSSGFLGIKTLSFEPPGNTLQTAD